MIGKFNTSFFLFFEALSPFIRKGFDYDRLYKSYYRQKNAKEAKKWISKSAQHKCLEIEYMPRRFDEKLQSEFFKKAKHSISDNLDLITTEFFVDFISYWYFNDIEFVKSKTNSSRVQMFLGLLNGENLYYEDFEDVKQSILIYRRIYSDGRFANMALGKPYLLSDSITEEGIVSWIEKKNLSRKKSLKFYVLISRFMKSQMIVEKIYSELSGDYSVFAFDIYHAMSNINMLKACYEYNPKIRRSLKRKIVYFYYESDYESILKSYSFLKLIKSRSVIYQLRNYITYACYNNNPEGFGDLIDGFKKLGLPINSLGLYHSSFNYGVKKTNLHRLNIQGGLGDYISLNINKIDLEHVKSTLFESDDYNVLLVSESGVADEVRWSYLYSSLNLRLTQSGFSHVTVVCEPRYINLFTELYPSIRFVAHSRKFRGSGESSLSFHKDNIPCQNSSYDFIFPVSVLFNVLSDTEITTKLDMKLIEDYSEEVSLGVLFSSSLAQGFRNQRYAIDPHVMLQTINKLRCIYPRLKVICLQSPVSEDIELLCKENNILIPESVDLYNDFYSSYYFYKEIDYVVGPSSLNTELAAASGSIFYHICNSPEAIYMRNGNTSKVDASDIMGNNTISVSPRNGFYNRTPSEITEDCLLRFIEIFGKNPNDFN